VAETYSLSESTDLLVDRRRRQDQFFDVLVSFNAVPTRRLSLTVPPGALTGGIAVTDAARNCFGYRKPPAWRLR
jgi:hypothetical protein